MSLLNKAGGLIHDTLVYDPTPRALYAGPATGKDRKGRRMAVNLIVFSHHTAREMMREDISGTVFRPAMVKTEPDRIYGVRIAYDDSMGLGEMAVAEAIGDLPT